MGIPLYRESINASKPGNGGLVVKVPASCPYVEAFAARHEEGTGSGASRARAQATALRLQAQHHHHHHHHHNQQHARVARSQEDDDRQRRLYLSARRNGARVQTLTAAQSRSGSSSGDEGDEGRDPGVMSAQVDGMDIEMHMDMQTGETWTTPAERDQSVPRQRHRARQVPVLLRQSPASSSSGEAGLMVEAATGTFTEEERRSMREELAQHGER
ncbi:hypothetical protein BCR37DRAFT_378864 [Protomyces lactucae-debilis]|uniref:Uncharacterized protein n=1 Tax=Protomyces lactucae-debilis TaxID=2754530 RepID=A0A1Y2FIS3_PROLT|nr:uncharacterized protein BCR37DRAFT_378864 [Protomyces lactucae-debilis]ORY83848.1 hypothetical protein BCR37DRAFT_378864 [Protomyces lactucae-debilis]